MELLALVQSPDHVGYRYRLQAFEPALTAAGWRTTVRPLPRGVRPFLAMLRDAERADVVFLQKRLLPIWKLKSLRRSARRLVYDVDDAVFLRDSNSAKRIKSRARWNRFAATIAACDAATVGNRYLQSAVAAAGHRRRAAYFPTAVDVGAYTPMARDPAETGLKLVWIGSASTLPSLEAVVRPLHQAGRTVPELSLRVICNVFPDEFPIPVERCPWSQEAESELIAGADVGLSWLPRHRWSRGKCGLKVLQYMAAGLPVIANRFGVHHHLVSTGETGYLVDRPGEWSRALARLAGSESLRRKMGALGRNRAFRFFDSSAWAPRFVELLEHLVATPSTISTWPRELVGPAASGDDDAYPRRLAA